MYSLLLPLLRIYIYIYIYYMGGERNLKSINRDVPGEKKVIIPGAAVRKASVSVE